MIEFINVKKNYITKSGSVAAIDGMNLRLSNTGMVFVTGKSGSGAPGQVCPC